MFFHDLYLVVHVCLLNDNHATYLILEPHQHFLRLAFLHLVHILHRSNQMAGWIPNVFGKRDARQSATEAIISLREQLAVLDKKEEHLERRVEEEHAKAKSLVAAKKTGRFGQLPLL